MKEERHLEVGLRTAWIAHDQAAEQPEVHVVEDVGVVIVERPRADRLFRDVECVTPLVAGADHVAPASVSVGDAKRPRAVGIDAVDEAVNVEAVREVVGVEHVDEQPLSRLSVEHRARHPAVVSGLVDVGRHDRRGVRNRERRIQILPIHHGVELALLDLGMRNVRVFMRWVSHAVATMLVVLGIVGRDGAIRRDLFNLEIDVAAALGRLWMVTGIVPAVGVTAPSAAYGWMVVVVVFPVVVVVVVFVLLAFAFIVLARALLLLPLPRSDSRGASTISAGTSIAGTGSSFPAPHRKSRRALCVRRSGGRCRSRRLDCPRRIQQTRHHPGRSQIRHPPWSWFRR